MDVHQASYRNFQDLRKDGDLLAKAFPSNAATFYFMNAAVPPRLLRLAHRHENLVQSVDNSGEIPFQQLVTSLRSQ
jgi:hypothetical protein